MKEKIRREGEEKNKEQCRNSFTFISAKELRFTIRQRRLYAAKMLTSIPTASASKREQNRDYVTRAE